LPLALYPIQPSSATLQKASGVMEPEWVGCPAGGGAAFVVVRTGGGGGAAFVVCTGGGAWVVGTAVGDGDTDGDGDYDGERLVAEVARTTTKLIARFKVRKPEPLPPRQPVRVLPRPSVRRVSIDGQHDHVSVGALASRSWT
jgi:hypothetical protein